ncbi:MAG: hypothetical protein C9356_19980 [Oleiphilus sp.]|nr:MAG: hypothetical protein C9356_19980 [Oleiphilus sp.]
MALEKKNYDVIIVGASIAGCTAANLYAQKGLKVALVEKKKHLDAYKKLCSHHIQSSAVSVFNKIGLSDLIDKAGGVRNGIDAWACNSWIHMRPDASKSKLPTYGYNIRRKKLDPILRKKTIELSNVDYYPGFIVKELLGDGNCFKSVRVVKDNQSLDLESKMIVAADGRNSVIAKLSGAPKEEFENNRFTFFLGYKDLHNAPTKYSRIWMLDPNFAFAFPNDDGVTELGCFFHNSELEAYKNDPYGTLRDLFKALPNGFDLDSGKPEEDVLQLYKMPLILRPPAYKGIAFIGDAAMSTDPIWGMGCSWAVQSADWLVSLSADSLRSGEGIEKSLTNYRKYHKKHTRWHFLQIRNYASGRKLYRIEKLAFVAASKNGAFANKMYDFISRNISLSEYFSVTNFFRILKIHIGNLFVKTSSAN